MKVTAYSAPREDDAGGRAGIAKKAAERRWEKLVDKTSKKSDMVAQVSLQPIRGSADEHGQSC